MAVSVRLDPVIEARLTQQANLLGITKSEFIKDAIERVLGMKDPAALLREVRAGGKLGRRDASANVSRLMKSKLRAQRSD
jgi:predicted DNA-binding protein